MKTQILAAIGETGLKPASLVNEALAANDRVKYLFSLLQMALAHGEAPDQPVMALKRERIGCGIDDPDLDRVVVGASLSGKSCHIPGAAKLIERIRREIQTMAAPILADQPPAGLAERLQSLLRALPDAKGDLIEMSQIRAIMQAGQGGADSPHHLVMDLHKLLNQMQAALAEETVNGAAAYRLEGEDRALVSSFMDGVNRTAKLKFNHPGLKTTATHIGDKLVIQNDIGTTDAHVIVIHVEKRVITLTYTDVHAERLTFFQAMLAPLKVNWETAKTAVLAGGSAFIMASGRIESADAAACRDDLAFLGSRLVFLIDWNRARKQLRGFLRGADRTALLAAASVDEIGHRGFLEMGGAQLVNQAIEATAGSAMHFGDRLCDVLGDAETFSFLQFVLRAATEGLQSGQSRMLIHDRIRIALAGHFSNEERQLMRLAADHAGLIFELANLVRDGLRADSRKAEQRVRRAGQFEHDADLMVLATRNAIRRRPDHAVFLLLMEAADDVADGLEDAAFLLDLDRLEGKPLDELQSLADLLVEASEEWVKALGHAGQIGSNASQAETEDFLAAIDRIAALEHLADAAERAFTAGAIQHAKDFRQLHLFAAIGGKFEEAADALKHASLILRDHVLEDVTNG